ncbi:MAG: type II toxin-antitoxin system RelE/ParE family toxin [Spirochaetia bacterium]|nr:type II toxin-antitoxin system RelE/ParE family toxin [Spirochaetia bacterium]
MDIQFSSKKLEKIFNSEQLLKKEFGEQAAKIRIRLAVLKAAPCLAMVSTSKPERRHELSGGKKGTFSVDLKHPFRLIFEPADIPVPRKKDGGIDLEKVISITILKVEDYH